MAAKQGRATVPRLLWLALAVLPPLLLLSSCNQPQSPDAPKLCRAPVGATQLDVDPDDSPETPWPKPHGEQLVVYFETGDLSERYAGLVGEAAQIWSRSACLNSVAAARCPAEANCVAIREKSSARDNTDGEFSGRDKDGVRQGGRITLYTRLLDRASDNGALATIVHEMGHALGLVHRKAPQDVMNAYTSDDTNPIPDSTDFYNLAVIYDEPEP